MTRTAEGLGHLLLRRGLAVAGALCVASGLILLATAPNSSAATADSKAPAHRSHHPAGRSPGSSQVTVQGKRLWNPGPNPGVSTGKLLTHRSSVTVAQSADLVNQVVHVSWRNFTPSNGVPYDASNTNYPVMVVECRSLHPTYGECLGDNNGGVTNTLGTPSNAVYTVTSPKGTGQADIEILTSVENQQLGCDRTHRCSIAVVPAQGGIPGSCNDHSQDQGVFAIAAVAFQSPPTCSWHDRIVIPLKFAPTPINCPILNASFTVIGSPMMQRAMDQWDAGLCAQSVPIAIQYNSAIPEPIAVSDVLHGTADVALTTRPAGSAAGGKRHFTYAPVAVSAVSVTYWADNPQTGQPQFGMKLDPRLVAKMLTTSYSLGGDACRPGKATGCDPGIDGNPGSVFDDPEFMRLNPHMQAPQNSGAYGEAPMVQSGDSDMTYETTRWIAANSAASAFVSGQFDRWGMHMNTYFLGLKYPTTAFIAQDPYGYVAHAYSPLFPLTAVPTDLVQNWSPATSPIVDPITGNYDRLPPEPVGTRALFAVMDEADAAAFEFPVAKLLNHAGRYVGPTRISMASALRSMVTDKNGITQQVSLGRGRQFAYPLTMVIYAMVPTSGISASKAASIARWLDFAAGAGQVRGTAPGQLPIGYLPLPASLRAKTLEAASAVLNQTGSRRASPAPTSTPSSTPVSGSATPPPSGSPSPTALFPAVSPRIVTVAVRRPQSASLTRYALPVLLIAGGLAGLGGASSLVATSNLAVLRRLRHRRLAWSWRRPRKGTP